MDLAVIQRFKDIFARKWRERKMRRETEKLKKDEPHIIR